MRLPQPLFSLQQPHLHYYKLELHNKTLPIKNQSNME